MTLTVLITGFGRFPGAAVNPTAALVRRLVARRRPALADISRIGHVFPASYAAAEALPALIARHRPDAVLLFGLAARTPHLRIETRAANAIGPFPDADRRRPEHRRIAAGAEPFRRGRAPFAQLLAAARAARVPARLSRDAGLYVCNFSYWHALADTACRCVVFVHVPRLGRPPGRRSSRRRPFNDTDLLRAGEAILRALVAAARANN